MRSEIEAFGNGWFELSLRLRRDEIDSLITALQELKAGTLNHFHLVNTYDEKAGLADAEISVLGPGESENMHHRV